MKESDTLRHTIYLASCGALGETPVPQEGIDWSSVCDIAREQSVLPLVYVTLLKNRLGCPDEVFTQIESYALSRMLKNDIKREKAKAFSAELYAAGIKAALFKGYKIAECYADSNTRTYSDIDVIVESTNAKKAFNYLKQRMPCIVRWTGNGHYGVFAHPVLQAVELHDALATRSANDIWTPNAELVYKPVELTDRGDHYELSHTQHFNFLCFHLFKHFTRGNITIQSCIDLMMFYRKHREEIDIEAVLGELKATHNTLISAVNGMFKSAGIDTGIPVEACDEDAIAALIEDIYLGHGQKTVVEKDMLVRNRCDYLKYSASNKMTRIKWLKIRHYSKAFQKYFIPYPNTLKTQYPGMSFPKAYLRNITERLEAKKNRAPLQETDAELVRRLELLKKLGML